MGAHCEGGGIVETDLQSFKDVGDHGEDVAEHEDEHDEHQHEGQVLLLSLLLLSGSAEMEGRMNSPMG